MKRVGSTAQRLAGKPYEKRVCRTENYPYCLVRPEPDTIGKGMTIEEYVDFIDDVGLEVQVVAATAGTCDRPRFPSRIIPPYPDVGTDPLPRFLELAHRRDVLVLTYYGMTRQVLLADDHPEWLQTYLDDGRPPMEKNCWFCLNSPYRDWLPNYLVEFLDHLDLDGFFFDGTNWGCHGHSPYYPGCCCDTCTRLFRAETGLTIPTAVDFASHDFRQFLLWQRGKLRAFLSHVTRTVRAAHPDAILDFNHYAGVYNHWAMGHPANPLGLEACGGHFFVEATIYDGAAFTAKYVKAHGGASGVWFGPTQSLPGCANHTAPYPEPLAQTLNNLAVMANGAFPIMANVPYPSVLYKTYMTQVFTESRKRVDFIEGETLKYAALHWSEQSRDFHRLSNDPYEAAADFFKRLRGTFEMLHQSHLLTDFVFDEQLTDNHLAPYKVLFLSNSACLSANQCEVIRRFVRNGGTLVATYQTSLQDEWGRPADNFQLADVLGVDYEGPVADGGDHGCVYLPRDKELARQFHEVICYDGVECDIRLRAGDAAGVLCTRSAIPGPKPLDRYRPDQEHDAGVPTVTVHAFGKGKAYYINGDVGAAFTWNPYPPLKRFVAELVGRTPPPFEVVAPRAIQVSAARRADGRLMIHLVNHPLPYFRHAFSEKSHQMVCTYFYNLEEVTPIPGVQLTFHDLAPASVSLPLQNLDLPISDSMVTVPEVKLHEVVLVS